MSQIEKIKQEIARLQEQLLALSYFQESSPESRPMGMFEGLLELIAEHGNAIEVLEALSDKKDARLVELENRVTRLEDRLVSSS